VRKDRDSSSLSVLNQGFTHAFQRSSAGVLQVWC
jgi:hypothetical protein